MAAQAGVAIHFFPVKAGRVGDKPTRIGSMDGQFKSGHLHVREGLGDFIEEYRTFPTSGRMDLLDATYYCVRPEKPLLRMPDTVGPTGHRYSPWHEKQLEQYEKSVDATTGYGS